MHIFSSIWIDSSRAPVGGAFNNSLNIVKITTKFGWQFYKLTYCWQAAPWSRRCRCLGPALPRPLPPSPTWTCPSAPPWRTPASPWRSSTARASPTSTSGSASMWQVHKIFFTNYIFFSKRNISMYFQRVARRLFLYLVNLYVTPCWYCQHHSIIFYIFPKHVNLWSLHLSHSQSC